MSTFESQREFGLVGLNVLYATYRVARRIAKLLRLLGRKRYRTALRCGVAAAVEHEAVLRATKCESIVDIGANKGQFALVARMRFPDAKIYSFEPLSQPSEKYRKLFGDDPSVKLFGVAIGPASSTSQIHVSKRDDSSSLLPITKNQETLFPGTGEVRTETVRVAPLGEFLSPEELLPPALLKLDVQGYELAALTGCEQLLERFSWVYVECSFVELYGGQALAYEVIQWLAVHGFVVVGIYNVTYATDGRAIQADFLFGRKSATALRSR